MQKLSIDFTILENRKDASLLSDLDAIIITYHILCQFNDVEGTIGKYREMHNALLEAKKMCYKLLEFIQGFVYLLVNSNAFKMNATVQNLPKFIAQWKKTHVAWYASTIKDWSKSWDTVVRGVVTNCRNSDMLSVMKPLAIAMLNEYRTDQAERLSLLQNMPWTGKIIWCKLLDWKSWKFYGVCISFLTSLPQKANHMIDRGYAYLKIELRGRNDTFLTKREKRTNDMLWSDPISM